METADLRWRKSTYSSNGGANCVEVANTDHVMVRDTAQHGAGPVLRFTPATWRRLVDQVKRSLAPPRRGAAPVSDDRGWPLRMYLPGRAGMRRGQWCRAGCSAGACLMAQGVSAHFGIGQWCRA
jgi:Domain of unknown function (DUF397)